MIKRTKSIDPSQYIGITETGEVAFDLSVFDRLYNGNIIITKRLTDRLIEKLVEHSDKIILHLTCTGLGNTKVEPFVPTLEQTYEKFKQLLNAGFPVSHVVLRIDPIIPTDKGIATAERVVQTFFKDNLGIKRVRYSILDMYPHVKERFTDAGFPIPYDTFHAPLDIRLKVANMLNNYGVEYEFFTEACGEPGIVSVSCLSQKDIDILGLTDKITLIGNAEQRKHCNCPSNKKQILQQRPQRCSNKCVYCFWKDN